MCTTINQNTKSNRRLLYQGYTCNYQASIGKYSFAFVKYCFKLPVHKQHCLFFGYRAAGLCPTLSCQTKENSANVTISYAIYFMLTVDQMWYCTSRYLTNWELIGLNYFLTRRHQWHWKHIGAVCRHTLDIWSHAKIRTNTIKKNKQYFIKNRSHFVVYHPQI